MILLLFVMFFIPEKGIPLGSTTLRFPSTKDFFVINLEKDTLPKIDSAMIKMVDSLAVLKKIDSTLNKQKQDSIFQFKRDSIFQFKMDSIKKVGLRIQGNTNAYALLYPFFKALDRAKKKKVRIMHYGDSQIESDRITSYLRNELQKKFGGSGVGLFPVIQVSPKWTLQNKHSENWKRYVGFGKKDSTVLHKKYGALMNFCRFSPIIPDTINTVYEGWIEINKTTRAYNKIKRFSQLHTYMSSNAHEVNYTIEADDLVVKTGKIAANTPFIKLTANFIKTPNTVKVTFKSKESPDVYGFSLEGNQGVVMDNIPLRGSSGTLFTRQDATLLKTMYQSLSPNLLILEFGGNTVPYIRKEKAIKAYGRRFKRQIAYLKKLNPNTPIIVIGPGDMSYKNKTEYLTEPNLEGIRDAVKNAALSSDCLFWDMYENMGGENSMPKWVTAEPPLGASDYIHFTSTGAIKIAKIFKKEIFKLYEAYKNVGTKEKEVKHDSIR